MAQAICKEDRERIHTNTDTSTSDERLLDPIPQSNKTRRSRKKRRSRSGRNGFTHPQDTMHISDNKKRFTQHSLLTSLPLELLLKITSDYALSVRDLLNLSLSCKYFSAPIFSGRSLAEEAARLSIHQVLSYSIPKALERIHGNREVEQEFIESLTPSSNESWLQVYDHVYKSHIQPHSNGTMCCAGGSHTAVMKDGELYTFGLGKNGQLGTGNKMDVLVPTQVNIQAYGRDYRRRGLRVERVKVRSVSCGLLHSAMVSAGGVLYTCGLNLRGELGYPVPRDEAEMEEQGYFPCFFSGVYLPDSITVQTVECGDQHTALTTDTGLVYTFGGNEHGQLGLGDLLDRKIATRVEALTRYICIQVSAFTHTAVVTACGKLFTFGNGDRGQLGLSDMKSSPVPKRVDGLRKERVVHVAAGYSHMLMVTSQGVVYSCGWNAQFRLGIRDLTSSSVITVPVKVFLPGGVKFRKVWTGMSHSLALSEGGMLYAWGRNLNGELGMLGEEMEHQSTPTCILGCKEFVVQASGGMSHTLAVTADGGVYSWGLGAKGRLGHGTTHNKIYPELIKV